ncbi:hypothetical protein ABW21_db0200478 [Orbilia brochopaga]|nr:hypothetical protein ABW21_db0200478 [Drechslerella brochopaga]
MSTRALRKAQQRAEQERLAALAAATDTPPAGSDDEAEEAPIAATKPNLFAMLEAELEEAAAEDDNDPDDEDEGDKEPTTDKIIATTSTKPKKKKKKKKSKGKGKATVDTQIADDEFDTALEALKLASISSSNTPSGTTSPAPKELQLQSLLRIDRRFLDPENEMRKLFGRVAAAREATGADRANQELRQLGQRVLRPNMNRDLARRSVFVHPGYDWPRDGSGGLSMELVERGSDGTTLFRYVHSRAYQDTQRQFNECVRSINPDRMFLHLETNPYHVSTLLQGSHITSTQTTDQAGAQILLKRALYALGRCAHSLFPQALAAGSARLGFHRFEDRELFFAGWQYIFSLSRRGLWRTGLEFVRLLLQMDPIRDPLCLVLLVDQYALKSRMPEVLLELAETPLLKDIWQLNPNIAYSTALAHLMAGSPETAKAALLDAIKRYPWMLTKLHGSLSEANSSSLPEGLWGCLPPNDTYGLLAELYVARMSDHWNIPEHAQFLLDTLGGMGKVQLENKIEPGDMLYTGERLRDLARHVFLMDPREGRTLIGFLPKQLREDQGYNWDVLPPTGEESSYQRELKQQEGQHASAAVHASGAQGLFETFLRSLMPNFQHQQGVPPGPFGDPQEQVTQMMENLGPDESVFEVEEADLQAILISMVDDGDGFTEDSTTQERALSLLHAGIVPQDLRQWFLERYELDEAAVANAGYLSNSSDSSPHLDDDEQESERQEVEEGPVERDTRAIDRLVAILGTGDPATLRMRVERMFEGQGEEMAEVRRQVEARLGLS